MQAVGVLVGIDGGERGGLVEALRQRQLEQDAVDPGIGAQRAQQLEQLALREALRIEAVARGDADGVGRALLVADVDLRGLVLADEHDAQGGRHAAGRLQLRDPRLHVLEDALLDGLAVEDHAATRRRRTSEARPLSGSIAITTPCSAAGPLAGSNRTGICVRKRCRMMSRATPMTPSGGPVMPRSGMWAGPSGR